MPTVIVLLGDINKTDNPCEVFKTMPGTKSTHTLCKVLFVDWFPAGPVQCCVLLSFLSPPDVEITSRSWTFVHESVPV